MNNKKVSFTKQDLIALANANANANKKKPKRKRKRKNDLVIVLPSQEFETCETLSPDQIAQCIPLDKKVFHDTCTEYANKNGYGLGPNAEYIIEGIAELGGRCKCRPNERICQPGCHQMTNDFKLWGHCVCNLFTIKKS